MNVPQWRFPSIVFASLAFVEAAYAQSINDIAEDKNNPIYASLDVDVPAIESYALHVIDLINFTKFPDHIDEFPKAPDELVDIVFIAKADAIKERRISDSIISGVAPEVSQALATSTIESDFCHVVRVDFSNESIFYAIQSTESRRFDPRCFHVVTAIYLDIDYSDIAKLSTGTALARIFEEL